jgi:TolB-like protein/Tfp pilus assembly protein PilF
LGDSPPRFPPDSPAAPTIDRLDSWKEIATYLRRDVRTVQRWEAKNGLPVHRHSAEPAKGSPVHAFRSELEHWLHAPAQSAGDGPGAAVTDTAKSTARLLVLPFLNLTGDTDQEYLSDALTDEAITWLATAAPDELAVIARTTAMHYKGARKDVGTIGRQVDADYVIEGGMRRQGDATIVNVQFIRVADQVHLWAKRFTVAGQDVFRLPQTIARCICEQLGIASVPRGEPDRWMRRLTNDLEAHTLYRQGRYHWLQGTPEGFATATQCFERAIARDPGFALAYDALAEMYWYLGFFGLAPAAAVTARGLFYAMRALDLDDSLAETHALLGLYRKEFDFKWSDVKREMDRAVQLDARSPTVKVRLAMGWLLAQGKLREAIAALEDALETDPLSVFVRAWYGCMLWLDRQYDRAIEQGRLMIETEPAHYLGYWQIGLYFRDRGAFEESIAALQRSVQLSGGSLLVAGWLGLSLGQAGRDNEAREMLDHLRAASDRGAYVPPTSFAWTHLGLGQIDEAFVWMGRAAEACDHMIMPLRHYPFLDGLRTDPRYLEILGKLNYRPDGGVVLDP